MFCPYCGNDILDHASICEHCGSLINLPAELSASEIKRLRKRYEESDIGSRENSGQIKKVVFVRDHIPALYISRVFAFAIDWGIIIGMAIFAQTQLDRVPEMVPVFVPLAAFLYFSFLTAFSGRTIGKVIVGIKVISEKDGSIPSLINSLGRTTAYLISMIFLMVGFLSPYFDSKSRCWHDMLSGTRVIYQR